MADPGRLLNRQELLRAIWGDSAYRDPAGDRRAHPAPAREARARGRQAALHPHRARRGVPAAGAVGAMWARWRGALGLRGRIIGVVLITSVATLVVAALALLGPLEQSLRNAERNDAQAGVRRARGPRARSATREVRSGQGDLQPRSSRLPRRLRSQGTGGASISPNSERNAREEEQQYKEGQLVARRTWSRRCRASSRRPARARSPCSATRTSRGRTPIRRRRAQPRHRQAGPVRRRRRGVSHWAPRLHLGSIGGTQVVREAIPFTTHGLNAGTSRALGARRAQAPGHAERRGGHRAPGVPVRRAGRARDHSSARDPAVGHDRPPPAPAAPRRPPARRRRARRSRCRPTAAATRWATSAARSTRCSTASSSRRRRAGRSSRPPRTSCARRWPRSTGCSSCSTTTSAAAIPTWTTHARCSTEPGPSRAGWPAWPPTCST